ncbi:hypothetical protein EVAR_92536_1 [Eumeta japonica]|uniref:PiggyBac transposable element-derived protein domain-containing protein n=1 Tax=Eumeta variegata TaxID=151549 RepID=A0A4C2A614_EUMVA|nr:hypothetical protein EVAR_92536_1 [Eumeta japonica]
MEGWILERAETDLQFTGDISLPLEITALNTPYQFFKYLFTDDIFLYISQETNKYAVEKRPEKPSNITVKELEQFIGTIKANRIPGYKVPVEKDLKKGRGTTVEKLTTIDNTDISVVTWRTLADSDPYLPLADFKCAVAEGLSQSNKPSTSGKRGRPSYELENAIEAKKLRGPIAIMPSRDVRLDQIDHMPLWTTRQRCKVPECNGRWPNHRNIPLSTLLTTSSFKPYRSLTSQLLRLSFRVTPHILRSDRIATALILFSFFFCHTQLSLPHISVEIRTPLWIAKSACRERLPIYKSE